MNTIKTAYLIERCDYALQIHTKNERHVHIVKIDTTPEDT